jgi:hypothetical protein
MPRRDRALRGKSMHVARTGSAATCAVSGHGRFEGGIYNAQAAVEVESRLMVGQRVCRARYTLQQQTVEPLFGIIKEAIGFRRFMLRERRFHNLPFFSRGVVAIWRCAPMLGRDEQGRYPFRPSCPPVPLLAVLGRAMRVRCGVCRAVAVRPGFAFRPGHAQRQRFPGRD